MAYRVLAEQYRQSVLVEATSSHYPETGVRSVRWMQSVVGMLPVSSPTHAKEVKGNRGGDA